MFLPNKSPIRPFMRRRTRQTYCTERKNLPLDFIQRNRLQNFCITEYTTWKTTNGKI